MHVIDNESDFNVVLIHCSMVGFWAGLKLKAKGQPPMKYLCDCIAQYGKTCYQYSLVSTRRCFRDDRKGTADLGHDSHSIFENVNELRGRLESELLLFRNRCCRF